MKFKLIGPLPFQGNQFSNEVNNFLAETNPTIISSHFEANGTPEIGILYSMAIFYEEEGK